MNRTHPCPDCSSRDTLRSSRRWTERWMLGLRPYRCSHCDHRFYVPMSLPKARLGRHITALAHELNPFRRFTLRRRTPITRATASLPLN